MSLDDMEHSSSEPTQPEQQSSIVASSSRAVLCPLCQRESTKYTCPKCGTKTCSAACSRAHKTSGSGCSGQRDRAGFVGMDTYGDIGMWRDLAYLRQVGDAVKSWGKDLAPSLARQSKLEHQAQYRKLMSKGKEREHAQSGHTPNVNLKVIDLPQKLLRLRTQLGRRGVELLFLPREMQRHKQNRGNFNPKLQKLSLTVSVCICGANGKKESITPVHQQDATSTLKHIISATLISVKKIVLDDYAVLMAVPGRPVVFSRNGEPLIPASEQSNEQAKTVKAEDRPLPAPHASLPIKPTWLPDIAPADEADNVADIAEEFGAELPSRHTFSLQAKKYWQIDPLGEQTLEDALCGTTILEWPEFELWPRRYLEQKTEAKQIELVQKREYTRKAWNKREREPASEQDEARPPSRRKLDDGSEQNEGTDNDDSSSDSSSSASSASNNEEA